MKKTYEDADAVLVMDSHLQSQSILSKQRDEILAMIYCTKWNRRLWTLQERVLAGEKLFFQFKDRTLSLDSIILLQIPATWLTSPSNDKHQRHQIIFETCLSSCPGIGKAVWTDIAAMNHFNSTPARRLTTLERMLPFRATSKSSDEAICLAGLLDLDMHAILSAPVDERMEKLWSVMKHIPQHVVFWIGPKLERKGFRWAPSTLLNRHDILTGSEVDSVEAATLTTNGLLIRSPGWLLGCSKGRQIKAQFYMVDTSDTVYMVSCINPQNREYYSPEDSLNPWLLEPTVEGATLYLLSQFDLDETNRYGAKLCHDSLLVLNSAIDQGIIHARCFCPATVRKLEVGSQHAQSWLDCTKKYIDRIPPAMRERGLWSSAPEGESGPNAIDLLGCSAFEREHPWCLD